MRIIVLTHIGQFHQEQTKITLETVLLKRGHDAGLALLRHFDAYIFYLWN